MNRRLRSAIAVGVFLVWLANYLLALINHHYRPPAEVSALMLVIAGAFFQSAIHDARATEYEEIRHEVEAEYQRAVRERRREAGEGARKED